MNNGKLIVYEEIYYLLKQEEKGTRISYSNYVCPLKVKNGKIFLVLVQKE